jgi:predicted nucleic acid-binding protein
MIVVDVNIIAYYIIEGERTNEVAKLRHVDAEWMLPAFWNIEFQSILWKYVRVGGMPAEQALSLLDRAISIVSENEVSPPVDKTLRDALSLGITVYDAQYVSLANQLGVPCITEDKALLKACPGLAVSMHDFIRDNSKDRRIREKKATYRIRKKSK